ncbi:hypothetical protein WDU94_008949 [Cyamophila willieti]
MCCKTGGLITRRHNEVRDLLGELCEKAWGNVTKEPLVIEDGPGLRGDLSVRGVWEAQREALFDIRVTDTDAPSYTSRSVMSVLRRAEEEKKEKYKEACEARHVTFTPLVTSVDGLFAPQIVTFVKVLAERLSERMGMEYGRMMGWLRTRIGIVPIYKEKGDIQECSNYRGIKLMSHSMKLYERIIDQRLRKETQVSDEQFGFMPGRGTTDAVFALRQLMEVHREEEKALVFVFIDLEKANDRVPRDEIWRRMRVKGTPEKYVRIVKDMYDGAVTRIRSSVGVTAEIPVQVGLHQGSALSPYLFDLIMDVLTGDVRKRAPWCMMFADDIVLCERSKEEMDVEVEKWKNALEKRGLKINRTKTVQLNFGMDEGPRVQLDGEELIVVDKFKYLGSMVDKEGDLECEIAHRVAAAWMNWKKMTGVLCDKRMSLRMKGKTYKTVVRPALMYGAETWAMKKVHERKMEVAEMRMLRWSCGVTRLDRIRNEVIRNKIKVKIQQRRLQ